MSTGAERRRSPRVSARTQVVQVESEGQVDITLGHTRDVSIHGLYVEVRVQFNPAQDPAVDDLLFLRFTLPGQDDAMEAKGRVARVDHGDDGQVLGFGVEFVDLSEQSRVLVESFVTAQGGA